MFCVKLNDGNFEKLQERAPGFVFKDIVTKGNTYEELFEKGDFLTVTMQRSYFLEIELDKYFNNSNPKYLNDLLCPMELAY